VAVGPILKGLLATKIDADVGGGAALIFAKPLSGRRLWQIL